uniref:Uncharacterized protein n=1 Tax=Romanomermis culicivorax TaxID=13658 RepID=A0A915HU49_ROMCU
MKYLATALDPRCKGKMLKNVSTKIIVKVELKNEKRTMVSIAVQLLYLDVRNADYNGPACTVRHVPHYIPDKNARILDICAGTGACAVELKKLGYENLDALDGCKKMLTVAQNRRLYKQYYLQILTPGVECPIDSDPINHSEF